ncbi:MAG: hypothetical protein WBH20_08525 [Oceanisphaera sp.]|uniref:hypothetical protein n=1 Tax=Oceanisphaera sp. TaxID=1929979 RepID=UPI003C724273
MLIDLDLVYDDLIGYAFYHRTEVKAVIGDKVKCADDEVIEFYDDVEFSISDFDDIVILEKKETIAELESFIDFLMDNDGDDLVEIAKSKIEKAKPTGVHLSYIALCNDEVFDIYDFSI